MRKLLPHVLSRRKTPRVPVYLIQFLTNRCNARCPHCFVHGGADPRFCGEELTVTEIARVAESCGDTIYSLNLTGGEPFLRPDLAAVCEAWLRQSGVEIMQLFTNGYLEDAAFDLVEHLTRSWPGRRFVLVTSLDDLPAEHDRFRGLAGGFERALRLHQRLRDLGRENLDLDIGVTVSAANEDRLDELYDLLVRQHGVRTLSSTLVRGEPRDPRLKRITPEKYRRFGELIAEGVRKGELDCFRGFPGADLLNAKSALMRRETAKILREGYQSPCFAGRLAGVIHAGGEVHACEILSESCGNLRDFGFSLAALWASPQAEAVRADIWRRRCYCTHECFATLNILFNPRHYPELLAEYVRIKMGK